MGQNQTMPPPAQGGGMPQVPQQGGKGGGMQPGQPQPGQMPVGGMQPPNQLQAGTVPGDMRNQMLGQALRNMAANPQAGQGQAVRPNVSLPVQMVQGRNPGMANTQQGFNPVARPVMR